MLTHGLCYFNVKPIRPLTLKEIQATTTIIPTANRRKVGAYRNFTKLGLSILFFARAFILVSAGT